MQFTAKKIKNDNIKDELLKIGFDKSYIDSAAKKHEFITLKIQKLPFYCATVIKETALSNGADAGIHRDVLTHKTDFSDLILSGTKKQLEIIAKSLYLQPFGLKQAGAEIERLIQKKETSPLIMGILNITEDSFSDGGKFSDPKKAIEHTKQMILEGAKIIDIGAESTRPGASPVDSKVEIEKLLPVLREIKKMNTVVSIDTRNSTTARKMIEEGADIINDVSGLNYDNEMINIIKESNAQIVIMHSRGTPFNMDNLTEYENLADEIYDELNAKIRLLNKNGVDSERIIIDTGFGFAKDINQNFEILKRIQEFNSLGVRNLAGTSRKRFLKSLIENSDTELLDDITALSSFYLFENGIDIVRVHNVKKTKLALDFYNRITK